MLRVVVVSEEDDTERLYRLSATMTVSEVVSAWKLDEGTEEEWSASREGGATLTGAEELVTVSEGKKTVLIYLERRPVEEAAEETEETVTLSFSIFGERQVCEVMVVSLSLTMAELYAAIRERFGLSEERYFRLVGEEGPLRYGLALSEVDLPVCSPVLIDLAYEIEVEDDWSGGAEKHLVYASERLSEVLELEERRRRRLFLCQRQIDSSRTLSSILPAEMRQATAVRLFHTYERRVSLQVNGRWKCHTVWPQDRLAEVLPAAWGEQVWTCEGRQVSGGQSFKEIHLQDDGLLLQDLPVLVKLSSGEGMVMWLPQGSTVAHLREAVLRREVDSNFCLKVGHRVLSLQELAHQAGGPTVAIDVVRSENHFVVDVDGKETKWVSRSGDIRFSQFCRELLENGGLRWMDLVELEFRCSGCGREIRRSEEAYQVLPSDCCRIRSLRLSSYTPVPTKGE